MRMLQTTLSLAWLFIAISATAQSPEILDTDGDPVRRGVDYFILPAMTDVAGGLTLAPLPSPNYCPLYVAQAPLEAMSLQGLPVSFAPFMAGENIIRESMDLIATFSVATTCVLGTSWRIGVEDGRTGRRFIATEGLPSYFRIDRNTTLTNAYQIGWCPAAEACQNCDRTRCGAAGILTREGVGFLALDGPAFPFRFKRA